MSRVTGKIMPISRHRVSRHGVWGLVSVCVCVGPLPHTVGDFWRMVWELKLPTIVMLTELIERGIVSNVH